SVWPCAAFPRAWPSARPLARSHSNDGSTPPPVVAPWPAAGSSPAPGLPFFPTRSFVAPAVSQLGVQHSELLQTPGLVLRSSATRSSEWRTVPPSLAPSSRQPPAPGLDWRD